MESSSVGDYSTRLEMLLAFHCQLACITSSSGLSCSLAVKKFWCFSVISAIIKTFPRQGIHHLSCFVTTLSVSVRFKLKVEWQQYKSLCVFKDFQLNCLHILKIKSSPSLSSVWLQWTKIDWSFLPSVLCCKLPINSLHYHCLQMLLPVCSGMFISTISSFNWASKTSSPKLERRRRSRFRFVSISLQALCVFSWIRIGTFKAVVYTPCLWRPF